MEIKPVVLTGLNQSPTLFQGLTALAIAFRSYGTGSITRFIENLRRSPLKQIIKLQNLIHQPQAMFIGLQTKGGD